MVITACSHNIVMIGLLHMAYPDGCHDFPEATALFREGASALVFHQSCPCCDTHPHLYCEMSDLLMIAVWHLWNAPLLCLRKQRCCRAYSSRKHRCFRQEGMADCGLYHGRLHRHPHPAHLAHAASCQGMHPSPHTCPTAFIECVSNIRLACCDEE